MEVQETNLPSVGTHSGTVETVTEEQRDYGNGPEEKVVVVFAAADGGQLEKVYNAIISEISGLGKMITRVGLDLVAGQEFDLQTLVGRNVTFQVIEKANGYRDIPSGSIASA